ncbi:hypothetical protein THRCLA_05407 [Thraustotheca clavata]|uniref:F-box domain-containing protein n=1 Tax=Thraustotheca clavata TaxID=74557 RepID=A0A1V9ZW01_9STRA|nr:hypothetical protein THRCLA_05407 [Thraustotheca clavata]
MSVLSVVLEHMSEELIVHVFTFLTPSAIVKTMQLSKEWKRISSSDRIWRSLCEQRWHLPQRMMRPSRYGVHTYFGLFRQLQASHQRPQGLYSTHDKPTWGHSLNEGVETWLALGHRADCKTIPINGKRYIQLRVIVQNLSAAEVLVDASAIQVHYKNGTKTTAMARNPSPGATPAMEPKILAWNGRVGGDIADGHLLLRFFEFTVLSIYVECEMGCTFEADFLERAFAVWVPMMRRGHCSDLSRCRCALIPDHYHHFGTIMNIVDESIIWSRYSEFAGGFMVLNCKDRLISVSSHAALPARYLV